jgi:hypothetical protein
MNNKLRKWMTGGAMILALTGALTLPAFAGDITHGVEATGKAIGKGTKVTVRDTAKGTETGVRDTGKTIAKGTDKMVHGVKHVV